MLSFYFAKTFIFLCYLLLNYVIMNLGKTDMQKIIKLIKKSKSIAIFSHENPDPDAIGSALALFYALDGMGKKVGLFCSGEMSAKYEFLRCYDRYNTQNLNEIALYIAPDVASETMLGTYAENFLRFDNTIRLDHHATGTNYAKVNFVKSESATAVLIFELIKKLRCKITPEIANALYFGICGDTGIFRNSNTDSKTFLIASQLLDCGAQPKFVYTEFFDKKTVPYVKLTSKCLLSAEFDKNKNFAIMTATADDYKQCGANKTEDVGNLPNTYLACGYKISAILKEKDGEIRCSLRSKPEYDCTIIAAAFGGGGHKNASGCTIGNDLQKAKKLLKKALNDYFKSLR